MERVKKFDDFVKESEGGQRGPQALRIPSNDKIEAFAKELGITPEHLMKLIDMLHRDLK
jgi:hypothetical protein